MRVGQRLFLAVIPAVVGVLAVAGLAYWGRYGETAPEWIVAVGIVAAIGSLVVAWTNTRYVAQRIQRLADATAERRGKPTPPGGILETAASVPGVVADAVRPGRAGAARPDELDEIAETVGRLSTAVSDAAATRAAEVVALRQRRQEYAGLLSAASQEAIRRLDDIRLPLHILLDARFGDVNENQEEMLGAARSAAEETAVVLERLRDIADADRGALTLRKDSLRLSDVIASLLPAVSGEAQAKGVQLTTDIAPALPTVTGDRARLHEALGILLHEAISWTDAGGEIRITLVVQGPDIQLRVTHGPRAAITIARAMATRLIRAHGGRMTESREATELVFGRG